jgi:nicotinamidase-related amidase
MDAYGDTRRPAEADVRGLEATVDALLVIDVQRGMFADATMQPHDGEAVVGRIAELIAKARSAGKPLIFVQHDGGPGDVLERGQAGFELRPELTPLQGEPVVVKRFPSAFQDTELADLLKERGVSSIVACGMQTEYCVDTTCRSAFEKGFAVTLVGDAHTTFDSAVIPAAEIVRHHNTTLGSGFATVLPASSVSEGWV